MNRFKFEGEEYTALRTQIIADLIELGYVEANPKRWVRPDLNDIKWYFSEKGSDDLDAIKFFDYWDGLDWMARKTRIKSWKGRANTWIKNNEKYKKSNGSGLASYDNESTNWG